MERTLCRQTDSILFNPRLQMSRNALDSVHINSFSFVCTNSSFGFLRSECLAKIVSKTHTLVYRYFDRLEVFEGFDLSSEDVNGCRTEDGFASSFIMNTDKIAACI